MKYPTEEEWRCRRCGTLLGIHRGESVHVKHKRAQQVRQHRWRPLMRLETVRTALEQQLRSPATDHTFRAARDRHLVGPADADLLLRAARLRRRGLAR